MYDEIRDELKEKQEELFSWKAQLEMGLAEAPKGKLYRSASNGYEQYYIRYIWRAFFYSDTSCGDARDDSGNKEKGTE